MHDSISTKTIYESFMTSLKIYLQQSHRFQDFFHSDKSAKEQATLVNAQNH